MDLVHTRRVFAPIALCGAFTAAHGGTDPGSTYCTADPFVQQGCVSTMAGAGVPSASAGSGFSVSVVETRAFNTGVMFYGLAPANIPWQGAALCVQPPTARTLVFFVDGSSPATFDGTASVDFNTVNQNGQGFPAGTDVYVQTWLRDVWDPVWGTAFSDGYAFTYGP